MIFGADFGVGFKTGMGPSEAVMRIAGIAPAESHPAILLIHHEQRLGLEIVRGAKPRIARDNMHLAAIEIDDASFR
jgi:hypothetical protein